MTFLTSAPFGAVNLDVMTPHPRNSMQCASCECVYVCDGEQAATRRQMEFIHV